MDRAGIAIRALVVIVVVVPITVLVAVQTTFHKAQRVQRGWSATIGSPETLVERFSVREVNPTALRLEELAARLGIELAPNGLEGRARPAQGSRREFRKVLRELGPYERRESERAHRGVEAPPEIVASYLQQHAPVLDELRELRSASPAPRWETHADRPFSGPVPRTLGHVNLNKVLMADAFARVHAGDEPAALEDLEVAWVLAKSLGDRPNVNAQLVAVRARATQSSVLRQLQNVPATWRERLAAPRWRERVELGLGYEGWSLSLVAEPGLIAETGFLSQAAAYVAHPYARFCVADVSDDFRRWLQDVNWREFACAERPEDVERLIEIPAPWWNKFAQVISPGNMGWTIYHAARAELDLELTSRIVELGAGGWAASADPAGIRSDVCPEFRWIYTVEADGSRTISLDRELELPRRPMRRLPTRFTLSR